MKTITVLFLCLTAPAFHSCNSSNGRTDNLVSSNASLAVKPTLMVELQEIVRIRQGVEASWRELQTRIGTAESDIDAYSSAKDRLNPVKTMGKSIIEADSNALEGQANHTTKESERILNELATGLPRCATDLSKLAANSAAKAAAIRAKATEMRPIAEKNELMTKEDFQAFESNSVRIDAEIDKLATLVDHITRERSDLASRVAAMNAGFKK